MLRGSPGQGADVWRVAVNCWPCFLILSSLCSPDGYLYEREAILEYILHQKKEIARQMKVSPFYG